MEKIERIPSTAVETHQHTQPIPGKRLFIGLFAINTPVSIKFEIAFS